MAGTPGAGKTEVATSLLELSEDICRIDADVFRAKFQDIMVVIPLIFNAGHLG